MKYRTFYPLCLAPPIDRSLLSIPWWLQRVLHHPLSCRPHHFLTPFHMIMTTPMSDNMMNLCSLKNRVRPQLLFKTPCLNLWQVLPLPPQRSFSLATILPPSFSLPTILPPSLLRRHASPQPPLRLIFGTLTMSMTVMS